MDTKKKKSRDCEWFESWFGREYIRVYPHRNQAEAGEQVDFLEQVLKPARGARILDLCCGRGRHSHEMAQRGYNVTGLDLSNELIFDACELRDKSESDTRFILADMRALPLRGEFDIVASFFTSFGYFDNKEDDARVLSEIARVLKPGGSFLFDFLNPVYIRANLVACDSYDRDGTQIIQERWIDEEAKRINKRITIQDGCIEDEFQESVRLYTLTELAEMFKTAGLRIKQVFGNFDGTKLGAESPRMIVVAEKATGEHAINIDNIEKEMAKGPDEKSKSSSSCPHCRCNKKGESE